MDKAYIGIDTSCYTTSVACVRNGSIVFDGRTVLSVPSGDRGLRQSEILFQHNRNLPGLLERLYASVSAREIAGIGVTASPTAEPDSYMPAFLAGKLAATAAALSASVPLYSGTHQQMHIRAALYGAEEWLKEERFLAFHLSGGTTDLLLVRTEEGRIGTVTRIGRSADLHAGQMVDRIGVLLGCPFPCGPHLEKIARVAADRSLKIPSSVRGTDCSLSGAETMAERAAAAGTNASETAYAVYDCLARTAAKMAENAVGETGCGRILFAGGVSSSALFRELLSDRAGKTAELRFGPPELSSDNAVGIALLAEDALCSSQR